MKIASRSIGGLNPPFIVAEISGNHGGSLEQAKALIKAAKAAGASAVKTQCYDASTITLNVSSPHFIVQDGLWRGRTLHELYSSACTPLKWHRDLYKVAADQDIIIFSSVFDYSSIDLLEKLKCPAYKIASFEIVDTPLISYAAQTGKPLIISTGMASEKEILAANNVSGGEAAFLHCTSDYPGTIEGAELPRLATLSQLLLNERPVGISDHTPDPVTIPVAATVLGASIIEKHMKLPGTESEDSSFSITPDEFRKMVDSVNGVFSSLMIQTVAPHRNPSRQLRRSIYAVRAIKKGEPFTEENIRSIRPGYGAPPSKMPYLLGRPAPKSYRKGDPINT